MIKILLAEDELLLGKLIKEAIERMGYQVIWAHNGQDAYDAFVGQMPHLCVFDVMMPAINGFELAKMIRRRDAKIPILFLTAKSTVQDVVSGFESGGNDYLKKPFEIDELRLRIAELLKRTTDSETSTASQATKEPFQQIDLYTFNEIAQELSIGSEVIRLSFKESELLKNLLEYKNDVMPRKTVLVKLWGNDNIFNARTMDVYIARLRKYLRHDEQVSIINIRGFGYKLIIHS